jgi:hypothetical protein
VSNLPGFTSEMFAPLQRRSLCNPLLIGITSLVWAGIAIYWGIRMRSWRLAIIPALSQGATVILGGLIHFTATKEAYSLLGHLIGGCVSFAIAKRIKEEAIREIQLQ